MLFVDFDAAVRGGIEVHGGSARKHGGYRWERGEAAIGIGGVIDGTARAVVQKVSDAFAMFSARVTLCAADGDQRTAMVFDIIRGSINPILCSITIACN